MSLSARNPYDNPESWDYVTIAGRKSPGLAAVSDSAGRPYKWDKKEGPGTEGDTLTYRGQRSSEFSITFTLWLPEHYSDWDSFVRLFEYDASKGQVIKAVAIDHPGLEERKIRSVVTQFIGAAKPSSDGKTTIKVDLSEYYPPKKKNATSTPTSSKTGTGGKPGIGTPTPQAKSQQDLEIERLLAEAKKP